MDRLLWIHIASGTMVLMSALLALLTEKGKNIIDSSVESISGLWWVFFNGYTHVAD